MSKQTPCLKPKIMSEYFFISRVICPMEFGDDDHPLDAVNCKLAQKYIGEFCESMLAKIDINIDFYLLELPEDADAVPVKFISGDDIEPHCANLITLGKEVTKRISWLGEDKYYGFFDGDGFYIAFKLKGKHHWDYNLCKVSEYFAKQNPSSEGFFEMYGFSPYRKNEIIGSQYISGGFEDGFMVYYSEDKKHEYLKDESGDSIFSRMDRLKPEMFSAEWYKNCNSFVSADT
jgi:hypothetical protein